MSNVLAISWVKQIIPYFVDYGKRGTWNIYSLRLRRISRGKMDFDSYGSGHCSYSWNTGFIKCLT
uniref:Uncharacterized protein n=1 Tax=Arundo donax TaxID=35708 RepID=A0A0A9CD41_ARUDO